MNTEKGGIRSVAREILVLIIASVVVGAYAKNSDLPSDVSNLKTQFSSMDHKLDIIIEKIGK